MQRVIIAIVFMYKGNSVLAEYTMYGVLEMLLCAVILVELV